MTADESDPSLEYGSAAASIAILAGIAAAQLRQLLDLKDAAHYGFITITAPPS